MPGFLPSTTSLNTLDELKNLRHTITYTDLFGVSYPVTVTAIDTNPTVTVSGATISGYYTDSFNNDIQYRTPSDSYVNVSKFDDIDINNLSEMIYYKADTTTRKVYNYTATANGETKAYTINVDNNWTFGRDMLVRYVNITKYDAVLITWINSTGSKVTWTNSSGKTTDWVNFL
jgi:hypothetical protein